MVLYFQKIYIQASIEKYQRVARENERITKEGRATISI